MLYRNIYHISRVLSVSMEGLIDPCLDKRVDLDLFKSNTCHRLKKLGDIEFIIELPEESLFSVVRINNI